MDNNKVSGADLLVSILEDAGVEVVAGIPGHTVGDFALAVGKSDKLRSILVRHEATATFAADVYFRVSGRLMAAFTHAFPGALNGLIGVANAYADYSSLFFVTGNTASVGIGRGGYQELSRQTDDDLRGLVRPAVKRVWEPRSAVDIAGNTLAALREATSGRPGPVGLVVSQELWSEQTEVPSSPQIERFVPNSTTRPEANSIEQALKMIARAKQPVILAGNGVNLGRAREELRDFAERYSLPVATTASGKGAFPEDHALAVGVAGWTGTSAANSTLRQADLVIVLGARLAETTTSSWTPGATFNSEKFNLIQVDIEASAVANAYPVDVALLGDMRNVLLDLLADNESANDRSEWLEQIAESKAQWRAVVSESAEDVGEANSIRTGAVVAALRSAFDGPINLVSDCGKHHKWIIQQFEARADDYVISSMGGASMGVGLAGAIGAALARPDVPTVAWIGDGGLSMSLAALPTVAEYNLPITIVVIDDAAYGVVANGQIDATGRTAFSVFDGSGENPGYRLNFAEVAIACGIAARTVSDPSEIADAFDWAKSQNGPSLINVLSDRRSVQPSGGGVLNPLASTSGALLWS